MLRRQKLIIQWALGAVLLIDGVLLGVNWEMATAPPAATSELNLLKRRHDLMAADVARGQQIRAQLPAVEQQCDAFFKSELRPAGSGYSALVDNLGMLARESGLHTENVTFRQGPADKRGVAEIEITETIGGDYSSVVRFINRLEHAEYFYVLSSLSLAEGTPGELRLNLQLRTYFRT